MRALGFWYGVHAPTFAKVWVGPLGVRIRAILDTSAYTTEFKG